MRAGPKRAPSSPPDTPEPMKRRPFSRRVFSRRIVSVQSAVPPSMIMSFCSKSGPSGGPASEKNTIAPKTKSGALQPEVGVFGRLHQDDNLARLRERTDEFLEGFGAEKTAGRVRVFGDELLGFFRGAVVNRNPEA